MCMGCGCNKKCGAACKCIAKKISDLILKNTIGGK